MYSRETFVTNKTGLHARPAQLFVKEASKYESDIRIIKDENKYNAKSIMSILTMAANKGTKIIIEANGIDEEMAVEALVKLLDSGFGDEHDQ